MCREPSALRSTLVISALHAGIESLSKGAGFPGKGQSSLCLLDRRYGQHVYAIDRLHEDEKECDGDRKD
jgi:hypothetical protein